MTSSDFRETAIGYPESWYTQECAEIKIEFRSDAAREKADAKPYRERAVRCQCRNPDHDNRYDYFFISTGYAPNEVFVSEADNEKGGTFLRNLTIDVGIVRGG